MFVVNQVIKYLGQYTHRIAISNQRILGIQGDKVHSLAKDYRDNATVKKVNLEGVEFLRRFIQHVLPKGFMRIRCYGIYNATTKRNLKLQFTPVENDFEVLLEKRKKAIALEIEKLKANCYPFCKQGKMIMVEELPKIRSPAGHLPTILLSMLN